MENNQEVAIASAVSKDTVFAGKRFIEENVPADSGGGMPQRICTIDGKVVEPAEFDRQWQIAEQETKSASDLVNKGAIRANVTLPFPGWLRDRRIYDLGKQGGTGIFFHVVKYGNGTIRVKVDGPLGKSFQWNVTIPANDGQTLPFDLAWDNGEIKLSLCGKLVGTARVPKGEPS